MLNANTVLAEWVLNNIELDTSEDVMDYREQQGIYL